MLTVPAIFKRHHRPSTTAAHSNLITGRDGTWAFFALADTEHEGRLGEDRDSDLLDTVNRLVDLTGHRVWLRGTSQDVNPLDHLDAWEARYPNPLPDRPGARTRADLLAYASGLPVANDSGRTLVVLGVRFTRTRHTVDNLARILNDTPPPPPLGEVADDRATYRHFLRSLDGEGLHARPLTETAVQWVTETSHALGHRRGHIPDGPITWRTVSVTAEPYAPTFTSHAIGGDDNQASTRHVTIRHLGMMRGFDTDTRWPLFGWLNAQRVEWAACFDVHDGDTVAPVARAWRKTARDTAEHDTAHGVDIDDGTLEGIDRATQVVSETTHGEEGEAARVWGRVVVAVAGDTPTEALDEADRLTSTARRHQHAPLEADHGQAEDRWLFLPAEPWGVLDASAPHLRRWPLSMLAATGPAVTGHAGDDTGIPLGGIAGSASTYMWDPHGGPRMGRPGTWVVIAEQGGGKSSLASLVCDWSWSNGVATRIWDPSGMMGRLARMPHAADDVVEFPLSTAGKPGMLMPHFLDLDPKRVFYPAGPDGDEEWADAVAGVKAVRMDRAIDATLLALPYELVTADASVRSIVEEAVAAVGGDYGTHSREIIDALARCGDRGRELARMLTARAVLPDGAMVFPDRDVSDTVLDRITSDSVGVVITTPGLSIPQSPDRSTWQREHHRAALVQTLGWQLAVRDAWASQDPTTVWVDELAVLMAGGIESVRSSLLRAAVDSRKVALSIGFGAQTPGPVYAIDSDVDNLIGSAFIGRVPAINTARACLPLLGVPDGHGWAERITRLPSGGVREFAVSGWQREPSQPRQVLVDQSWWHADLLAAANTTPPSVEAVIPDRIHATV